MSDDLIIKYLLKEANSEEEARVKEWISSSPEHAREFLRFELIWLGSKKLMDESKADPEKAWDSFRTRLSQDKAHEARSRSVFNRYGWLKVAAILVIVAGAWSIYTLFSGGYQTIETGRLVRTETLPDGSKITLNRNTTLSYRKNFRGNTRSVRMSKGEAFFNVSPDKTKPFVIEADKVVVKVVGTSFNVKHAGSSTEIVVETGVVQVSMDKQFVELKAGEKVIIKDRNSILRKEVNTDQLYNYYRSKMFLADNTPLWRVVEVLNEAYDSKIVIENDKIRNLPLSAPLFKDESLDSIIRIITETFKISAVKEKDKIVLR